MPTNNWSVGSTWWRWDVHVHTPETVLNNQFKGDWEGFCSQVSRRNDVKALGITDYFGLRGYQRVLDERRRGSLGGVEFIFPNLEFKLSPPTQRRSLPMNLHLLVCPDDESHVDMIREALSRLTIHVREQPYSCDEPQLVRLGRLAGGADLSEQAALRKGVEQFKPSFREFQKWLLQEEWLRTNSLVAVSGGVDGPSDLPQSGWTTIADEIFRMAHIVFTSNNRNREFWLGHGKCSLQELATRFGGRKACLHGSDAHEVEGMLEPSEERYCWIRAERTWAGLRQVIYEPEARVHIGRAKPQEAELAVAGLRVSGASDWLGGEDFELNRGLVAIIGPRGSGKTAMADMLAVAGGASSDENSASFLSKAAELLDGAAAEASWREGERATPRELTDRAQAEFPRIRYLSQQFVESLCSGEATQLQREIEAVVFEHLDFSERLGRSSLGEVRETLCRAGARRREQEESRIRDATKTLTLLRAGETEVPRKRKRIEQAKRELAAVETEIKKAAPRLDAKVFAAFSTAKDELERRLARLRVLKERSQAFRELVANIQAANETIAGLRHAADRFHSKYGVDQYEIGALLPTPVQDIEQLTAHVLDRFEAEIAESDGEACPERVDSVVAARLEVKRLGDLLEQSKKDAHHFQARHHRKTELSKEITTLSGDVEEFLATVGQRRKSAQDTRIEAYCRIVSLLRDEEQLLRQLHRPVSSRLELRGEGGLEFVVRCRVDLGRWARAGAHLFDKRRSDLDEERLSELATKHLLSAWSACDPEGVRGGITQVMAAIKPDVADKLKGDATLQQVAEWVFGVDHIRVEYGLRFDGTDLEKLSPGTRGIALLTLYLDVDTQDERPLVIDQPEENLDPKSVYERLVPFFRGAKKRRQVVLVTHNPNLVVNTDADQVIVASSTPRGAGKLPRLDYVAGALEDPETRRQICLVLEGGEQAFRERERRYELR